MYPSIKTFACRTQLPDPEHVFGAALTLFGPSRCFPLLSGCDDDIGFHRVGSVYRSTSGGISAYLVSYQHAINSSPLRSPSPLKSPKIPHTNIHNATPKRPIHLHHGLLKHPLPQHDPSPPIHHSQCRPGTPTTLSPPNPGK